MNFLFLVIILVLFIVNNNKIKNLEMQLKELKKQLNTSKIANNLEKDLSSNSLNSSIELDYSTQKSSSNDLSTIKNHSFDESIEVTSTKQSNKINTNFDEEQNFISNSNTDFSEETITSNSVQTNNESKDYEKLIGKKFMNICASVLIFISLILFAQVIYPNLTDEIKVIGMYLISFAFFVFGFYRLQKNPKNVFNISVTSCGLGAIYISIILTNIYFKFINDITLYLLIATWAIFVSYLSRLKDSNIFHIIGELGITIALVFGLNDATVQSFINNIMLLTIFMIVGSITFYFSNKSNSNIKNIINNVFNLINIMLVIPVSVPTLENNFVTFSVVLVMGFIIYNIVNTFIKIKPDNKTDCSAAIFIGLYILELYNSFSIIIKNNQIVNALFTLFTLCLLVLVEFRFNKHENTNKILLQIFSFILVAIYAIGTDILLSIGFHAILAILFTIYGFMKNHTTYKYASFAYLIFHIFNFSMNEIASFILGTVAFSYLLFSIMKEHENYNLILKCLSYAFMQFFFLIQGIRLFVELELSFETSAVLLNTIMALVNVVAANKLFSINPNNNNIEEATKWLTGSFNIIYMITILVLIATVDNPFLKLIVILTAVAVYMVNSTNILKMFKDKIWPGIYVGLKLTILIITILMSFHVASILISIICLFISIMCIVLGFLMKYKSIRIYGLILSLISIAKLILFDIKYSSTLEHAISIFVCGILCFAVGSIYNYVDKKMIDDTNEKVFLYKKHP